MHVQTQFQYVVYTEERVHKSLFLAIMKARRLSDFLAAYRTVFANVLFSLCSTVRAETLVLRPPFSWNACTTVGTSVERLIEQNAAVLAPYLYNYLFSLIISLTAGSSSTISAPPTRLFNSSTAQTVFCLVSLAFLS